MKNSDIQFAINDISSYIVKRYAKENDMSISKALELLMKTALYAALLDKDTGLYCEPKDAVYDYFESEINGNPKALLKL